MLQVSQANQSIGIRADGVAVTYSVLKVQSVYVDPGTGTLNTLIAGEAYEVIPDAGELDQAGAITIFLLDGGGSVVGVHADVVVQQFPIPLAALVAAIWNETNGVETGVTQRQAMRAMAAVLAGKATMAGLDPTYKGIGVNTDRVVATLTGTGARTAVTLTL